MNYFESLKFMGVLNLSCRSNSWVSQILCTVIYGCPEFAIHGCPKFARQFMGVLNLERVTMGLCGM